MTVFPLFLILISSLILIFGCAPSKAQTNVCDTKCKQCAEILKRVQLSNKKIVNGPGNHKHKQRRTRATTEHFQGRTCEQLYQEHQRANYALEERPGRRNHNPITNYLVRRYNDCGTQRDIPLAVQAHMTHVNTGCRRTSFPGNQLWNDQMVFMDALLPSNSGCPRNQGFCDEKGHMVGSQMCGPIEMYNMAPQSEALNRNVMNPVDNGWYNLEQNIAQFAQLTCGYVDWMVVVNYEFDVEKRPQGFKVCATFHSSINNQDLHIWMYYDNL